MNNEQLHEYVSQQRAIGVPDMVIASYLRNNGWDDATVRQALKASSPTNTVPPIANTGGKSAIIFIALSVVVAIVAAVVLIMTL